MQNGTILQYFHWYLSNDGTLWKKIAEESPRLAEMGFTAIWLPPACKGTNGTYSIGYDIYDLYDLGEFDQKNSVRTKYGTKQEYIDAIKAIHAAGMQVYVTGFIRRQPQYPPGSIRQYQRSIVLPLCQESLIV